MVRRPKYELTSLEEVQQHIAGRVAALTRPEGITIFLSPRTMVVVWFETAIPDQ